MRKITCFVFSCGLLMACDRQDAGRPEGSTPPTRVAEPAPPIPSAVQGNTTAAQRAANDANTTLTDDSPSDAFKGRATLEVRGTPKPWTMTLGTRGDRSQFKLERPGANEPVTLLLRGDDVMVVNDTAQAYSTRAWKDVTARKEQEPTVTLDRTSLRQVYSGLSCVEWHLVTDKIQQADACVHALPAKLDADKLETLANVDLPGWVEKVLDEGYFPVHAIVREGQRELYRLDLSKYTPQPASEADMAAPTAYRELKPRG